MDHVHRSYRERLSLEEKQYMDGTHEIYQRWEG